MTFDALTIFGIAYGALSGGFVLATALAQVPRPSVNWHTASAHLTQGRRVTARSTLHGRGRCPGLAWQPS